MGGEDTAGSPLFPTRGPRLDLPLVASAFTQDSRLSFFPYFLILAPVSTGISRREVLREPRAENTIPPPVRWERSAGGRGGTGLNKMTRERSNYGTNGQMMSSLSLSLYAGDQR